jgi:2-methylcitrate dehydratase PrpD
MSDTTQNVTRELAAFLVNLSFTMLPDDVVARTEELFLDWIASALAGKAARPVMSLERFAETMGPAIGPSEILVSRRRTSPLFAALVNAASSHVVEQDDVHNGSVLHPGTVVFPAVLAAGQSIGATGPDLITAATAGYETGIRIGEFLGRSHYRVFHTTGTAGTLAAAAAVARLLELDEDTMLHVLGNAGTQAAGLWEFLREGADSKQLHTAKAAADGLLSAYLAGDGFTGAHQILTGAQGMAAGMSVDADAARLADRLGERWALTETSFKFHASCRHTHPAADALGELMHSHGLGYQDIARVDAYVHQAAIDVLGPVTAPRTIHQAKFCMGFVLALMAVRGRAGVDDFNDATLNDPVIRDWSRRVVMVCDPEVDAAYPQRWLGKVRVTAQDGQSYDMRVDTPKGDPGNPLSRAELEDKALRLAAYRQAATPDEMHDLIKLAWNLRDMGSIHSIFGDGLGTHHQQDATGARR